MTLYPVVLAGGSGTRLWPLSRESYPKQFLPLMGERTMVQDTLCRLDGMADIADPVVVCNEEHRFLLADQMRELARQPLAIVLEPVGRNTAPALTLAALRLAEVGRISYEDPVMLATPADHVIDDLKAFQTAVRAGLAYAESGQIVTFGVVPDAPETGYGYIRRGRRLEEPLNDGSGQTACPRGGERPNGKAPPQVTVYAMSGFVEKPDLETAKAYLQTGDYLWNSGIFMMRVSVWLSTLERHRPDIVGACRDAYAKGDLDGDFFRPSVTEFTKCPSDSIDYAVMEGVAGALEVNGSACGPLGGRSTPVASARCAVVPLDAGWSDIGAWSALWKSRRRDADGNVIEGDVYAHSTRDALLVARSRLLATVGLENVIVVETGDAVLVARRDSVQEVKEIIQRLKADGRRETEVHRKVHRPWGSYEIVDAGPGFQVRRLTINAGASISLHVHRHRTEHWVVVNGRARATRGDEVCFLTENQSAYVPSGTTHRLENPGKAPLEIVEVQSGSHLGEDDVVRLHDSHNRD